MMEDKEILRARDFWGALVLLAVSVFFLWRTFDIPLFGDNRAGVSTASWYNSAAIVPLGIFSALLILSIVLLIIAIRDGGAARALSAVGIGWDQAEALRFTTIGVILFFYVAGLVPRVDFIACSGLLITALTFGFHKGLPERMILSAAAVAVCGLYALVMHLSQSEWGAHDDDIITLAMWAIMTAVVVLNARGDRVLKAVPVIALIAPVLLVCAMAFGFRQNVPNRGGILFKQIEYHYYVTLRPIWRS
ncbi:hypothetical protein [Pontivivens insulae]|uniref:Tripartite tricarboxylate transporter TctB family protein n=1 Tax=Pontivivens insulae TaxID=1639689 RepID=A0A2R8AFD1_9RHOB|nr:hypothetical protein [Pontivivens insulae]RED12176.1 hypothetical protein DFR53_2891 [Pontivivens insulae]SPF30932.1 hypothetical protein POI8812_03278 [Pontivivens insulae]